MDPGSSLRKKPLNDEVYAAFERRFESSFARIYSYAIARLGDATKAQHLTRDVLTNSLVELIALDDDALARSLLRATKRLLRDQQGSRETR